MPEMTRPAEPRGARSAAGQPGTGTKQRAILVTGASTGICRRIVEDLAARGFFVCAGARKQRDPDAPNANDNILALRLDVTVPDQIDAAVKTVRQGGRGLFGLENNTGVFVGGPLIEVDVEDFDWLARLAGFSLHAATVCEAYQRGRPERLCRYITRPPTN